MMSISFNIKQYTGKAMRYMQIISTNGSKTGWYKIASIVSKGTETFTYTFYHF